MIYCDNHLMKLSPNEVENLIIEERKKWRIFRIQQVRAQAREEASRLRSSAEKEGENQKLILRKRLERDWFKDNRDKIDHLENEYTMSLAEFGDAHKEAAKEKRAIEAFEAKKLHNDKIAKKRGKQAIQSLEEGKVKSQERENHMKMSRNNVVEKERKRAQKVAQLPTPPKFKPKKRIPVKPVKKVMFHEAGTLTTSSYIPSSIKVVKEAGQTEASAREAAKRETQNFEQIEAERRLRSQETMRKARERERVARKRERTRDAYFQLMKEIEEAEENHQLSDLLDGEDSVADPYSDVGETKDEESQNREQRLEERVKQLLSEEFDTTENVPIDLSISKRNYTAASNFRIDVNETAENTQNIQADNEGEDVADDSQMTPLLGTNEIHFKETVPVHKLPIVKEKFLVRVPSSDPTGTQPQASFEAQDTPASEPPSQTVSLSSSAVSQRPSTTGDPSKSESSFEEIKIRINLERGFSNGSLSASERDATSTAKDDESRESSESLERSIEHIRNSDGQNSDLTSSSGSTQYLRIPTFEPSSHRHDETAWKNIKHIQEGRKKIERIISDLRRKPPDPGFKKKDFQTFKTPPRIYAENIKSDGSGERPMTKRQKFEHQKKVVLERYMRRLMQMKQEELRHVSASTVDNSGIDVSDGYLGKLVGSTRSPPSHDAFSTISSDMLHTKYSDIDTVPTKISSTSESSLPDSLALTPSSGTSEHSSCRENSPDQRSDRELEQQIYQRLLQLQQLKRKLILMQQEALGQAQLDGRSALDRCTETASPRLSHNKTRPEESALDWSFPTYQTPSREEATTSASEDSSLSLRGSLVQRRRDIGTAMEKPTPLSHGQRENFECGQNSFERKEDILSLTDSLNGLRVVTGLPEASKGSSSTAPSSSHSRDSGEKETSSSVASIPDMTQILKNFGLDWAFSMIKKMEIAEENRSTDS